jgi:hypothetical protein
MDWLFCAAHSFNCDISNWETGKVTNMNCIFHYAPSFCCDVSEWDVSAVVDMGLVFTDCPVDFEAIWEEHMNDPDW